MGSADGHILAWRIKQYLDRDQTNFWYNILYIQ